MSCRMCISTLVVSMRRGSDDGCNDEYLERVVPGLPIVAPAWLAGTLLALLSAPLGCLVLWRRMAFFADALAHGTLLGVALALWWQMPTPLGIGLRECAGGVWAILARR